MAALIIIVSVVLMAILAPLIAPQDPYNQETLDLFDARLTPGETGSGGYVHWLGTDAAGRDVFSAILFGLRTSLIVGVLAGTFALLLGGVVGLMAAYYGGRTEAVIMRIIDLQLSLPAILLALVLVAMLGQGLPQLVTALTWRNTPISRAPRTAQPAPNAARITSRPRCPRRCRRGKSCFATFCPTPCRR